MDSEHPLFTARFVEALRSLVERHHSIYPRIPPQGIFFESLVERAFLAVGWPRNQVIPTAPNSPSHDLTVGATKISVKRRDGVGHETNPNQYHQTLHDGNRRVDVGSAHPPCAESLGPLRLHLDASRYAVAGRGLSLSAARRTVGPVAAHRRAHGAARWHARRPTQLGHGRAWRRRRLVPRPLRRGRREVPDTAASGGALPNAARMGSADRRLSRRPYSHFLDLRKTSQ